MSLKESSISFSFTNNYLYSLILAFSSFSIAFGSLLQLNISDRISLQRGAFLISCGFVYFVSLTTFFNKLMLETQKGLKFAKRFQLFSLSDILDISNKLVSAVQAVLSFVFGCIVCAWSCPRNFLSATSIFSESYAWFASAYFLYDIFSMYRVWNTKIMDRLLQRKLDWDAKITNIYSKIPSLANGELTFFQSILKNNEKLPSFMGYMRKNPLMVFHHALIGVWGLWVVVHLRGTLGDCVFSYFYMMEFSTPFVSFRTILSILKLKSSLLYAFNGICIVVSFFIFRILMLPVVMYQYSSFVNMSIYHAISILPFTCKMSLLAVFVPQFYWFYLISKGAIKMIKGKQKPQ